MIAKELMGCRVCETSSPTEVTGKIVGFYLKGAYRVPIYQILTTDGYFKEKDVDRICIFKEDLDKIYKTIQPDPIRSRSEILDL